MGTRHRQAVIDRNGVLRIQQYGQWDGYPDGQGVEILWYLKTGNLNKYQDELSKINQATEYDLAMVEADDNWKVKFPYLSRDCGSNIHQMIEDGEVKFVVHTDEDECKKRCEGFYTIDFEKGKFISEFWDTKAEFNLDDLPTEEEYLEAMQQPEED